MTDYLRIVNKMDDKNATFLWEKDNVFRLASAASSGPKASCLSWVLTTLTRTRKVITSWRSWKLCVHFFAIEIPNANICICVILLVQALMPKTENAQGKDRKCTGQRVFYSPNNAQGLPQGLDLMPVCIFGRGCKCTRAQCLYILISHFEVKVLGLSDHFHFYLSIVMRPWAYYCNKP